MRKKCKCILALILSMSLFSSCTLYRSTEESTVNAVPEETGSIVKRPALLEDTPINETVSVTPCVEAYAIEPDLSNIDNLWQFYLEDGMAAMLSRNGFVVCGNAGREFYEIYEMNRYNLMPNFVTVDSLMHTYHLYFAHLLKNLEKNYLSDALAQLSRQMLSGSLAQYEELKGSEWESAARRNVAFFTVGTKLLDDSADVSDLVADIASRELDKIHRADGIFLSEITGDEEDYTQYIPRGYYENDHKLEPYFKAMMWYGRIHFSQKEEDLDRSALLITMLLSGSPEAYKLWESIYAVTSFFAGASDDLGVCEYAPVLYKAYGDQAAADDLKTKKDSFDKFHAMTASLPAPQVNSIPIHIGESNVILGFRFMGQRFTIDASIMQALIYSNVGPNSSGIRRMLPDVLDVPAALGSDTALGILEEQGAMDYEGYKDNMNKLRDSLAQENLSLWSSSLYAGWLNTLRPLLTAKGEGYPPFMQSEEWRKKDLECFAGSFTELKHDTILYSKQVIAEMGGGDDQEPDYRGYVEPEPQVYARFASLASQTAQGLKKYGMLDPADEENLTRLSQIAEQLLAISNKELAEEDLTEDEHEFIKGYGGSIEHFWYEAVKDGADPESISTQTYPAALVVDIATDPDGSGTVLEAATGDPSTIYVIVKVAGKLKIAKGSVYSFYQFPWPMDERLTDTKWRQMMGISPNDEGYFNSDLKFQQPGWTDSYRYRYEWE